MRETRFFRQADLLVQVMPFVNAEACFALKGGTAINFFVRDFPRLSVDIDLVYLPVEDRATTLKGIDGALQRIAAKIRRTMPRVQVREHCTVGDKLLVKLFPVSSSLSDQSTTSPSVPMKSSLTLKTRIHDGIVGLMVLAGAYLGLSHGPGWLYATIALGGLMISSTFTRFCPVYFVLDRVLPD